jgi:PIN domain-containing protein
MTILTIDTNLFGTDRPLASNASRRMLDQARQGRITVVVAELVIQEAVNKWADEVRKLEQRRRDSLLQMRARGMEISDAIATSLDLDAYREEMDATIRSTLDAASVRVAGFPSVGHQPVVERALRRRKPSIERGRTATGTPCCGKP